VTPWFDRLRKKRILPFGDPRQYSICKIIPGKNEEMSLLSYPLRSITRLSLKKGFRLSFKHFSAGSSKNDDSKEAKNNVESEVRSRDGHALREINKERDGVPGMVLAAGTAILGFQVAGAISAATSIPVSGIPLSILSGIAIRNSIGFDKVRFNPGISVATKTVLQGGIVAVAAKLSFLELMANGTSCLPVVVSSVGVGLTAIPLMGNLAGLPREMSYLLSIGTSICGVTAITALAPAIKAPPRDVAVAVANTVAFGTLGMLTYPYLFHSVCTSSENVGLCLGVAIHDTSQVLGAAMSYNDTFDDEVALKMATVTKLTRNFGLALAIPAMTFAHAIQRGDSKTIQTINTTNTGVDKETISGLASFQKYVPNFLVAFLGMSALRSGGDILIGDEAWFTDLMNFLGNDVSKYALGMAMAGVGLSTDASTLKGVGWKPFAVGGMGALLVGGTGFFVANLVAGS